jgi:DNA-directed RNA polymerase sigma subunit (sigma70/sigma32)
VSNDEDQLLQQYLSDVRTIPDLDREPLADLLARARDGEAEAEARVLEALLEVTAVLTQHLAPPTMRTLDAIQESNLVLMRLVRDRDVQVPVLALPAALAVRFTELEGGP